MADRRITVPRLVLDQLSVPVQPADVRSESGEKVTLAYGSPTHLAFAAQQISRAKAAVTKPVFRPAGRPAKHRSIWAEASALACLPNPTIAQIEAALLRLVDGIESRKAQLARYREANPLDPARFEAWLHGLHNAANRSAGKPELTLEQGRLAGVIIPDRVVVLSLDSRPDRWNALTQSIQTSDIFRGRQVLRHRARLPDEMIVPDWWAWGDTHYATRVDHMAMIEDAYAAGCEHVLILEDDAIFQDCFDAAYRAACKLLPADWLGLWVTSDGHKKPPVPIAPGLVRSTDQAMLHAYMLNRAGMRRVWHHLAANYKQIVDGATEDLHGIEPHFYATELNAVRQFGDRQTGERTQFHDEFGS